MNREHPLPTVPETSAFPALTCKAAALVLAVVAFLAVREYLLATWAPTEVTGLAIRQMQPDNAAAEDLRSASQARNWLLSGWAVLLVAVLAAAGVFWNDLAPAAEPDEAEAWVSPPVEQRADHESSPSPEQGEVR